MSYTIGCDGQLPGSYYTQGARHIEKDKKVYGKGWVARYTSGFQAGWTQVCDQGAQTARKERQDDEDSIEERPASEKRKTESGRGNARGEWRKVYTLADMDSQAHIFAARTVNKSYEFHAEDI